MWSPFTTDPVRQKRRDRVLVIVFALLSIVLVERAAKNRRGVLLLNQELGARFLAQEDLYFDEVRGRRIHTPYPPSYALVCAPLARLSPPVARRVWCLAQIAALTAIYRVLRRRLREHWPDLAPHTLVVFALGLLLASRFLLRDMKGGGGNTLYVMLALVGLDQALRSAPWRAGLMLGLGLVIKPTYALLLVFLALRGHLRAVLATLVCGLLLFCAPALHYGVERYAQTTAAWGRGVVEYATLTDLHDSALVPDGFPPATQAMNQSLRESVHRLLRPPGDSGAHDVRLFTVSPRTAILVSQAVGLALFGLLVWRTLRVKGGSAEWVLALTFVPLGLLLSPITWKAHHASLLPFMVVLVACARSSDRPRWLVPLLVLYYVTCNLASVELLGDRAGDLLQAVSIVAWFDLAFVLTGTWIAKSISEPEHGRVRPGIAPPR